MKTVYVYADFVCPFCFLAERVLSAAIEQRPASIAWRPFELRPAPQPTLRPEDTYLPRVWTQSVYPLANKLGVPIRPPSISPQPRTAKAFQLLALAQDRGLEHRYSMRVMQAFFQEDRDIGDLAVLATLAAEVGLDPDEVQRALGDGEYAERYREAARHARDEMHITVVPTIVVGTRTFRGTPTIDELRRAIDQLLQAA